MHVVRLSRAYEGDATWHCRGIGVADHKECAASIRDVPVSDSRSRTTSFFPDVLHGMEVEMVEIPRTRIEIIGIQRVAIGALELRRADYETININVLR